MDAYVSRRDLNQLLQKAVGAEHLTWAVVNGLSDNHFKRLDITSRPASCWATPRRTTWRR